MSEIKIITKFNPYFIESSLEGVGIEQFGFGQLSKRIINLQDEGVRKALIQLGWTPPKQENLGVKK